MFINFDNHLIPVANIAYIEKGRQFKDPRIIAGEIKPPENPEDKDFIYTIVTYFTKELLIDENYQRGMIVCSFDTVQDRDVYWNNLAQHL